MTDKYMKRYSTLLVIRKCKLKQRQYQVLANVESLQLSCSQEFKPLLVFGTPVSAGIY